jgi:DnaJ family protein C protein 13
MLLERGMLGYVVPLLLSYDATHAGSEEAQQAVAGSVAAAAAGAMPPADDAAAVLRLPLLRASAQATQNLQAELAVRALAALAGYSSPSPAAKAPAASATPALKAPESPAATQPCPAAQRALAALLTETLAPRLGDPDPLPLLRDLNSTVQTPQVIWNNSMRQELLELLEQQRTAAVSAAAAPPADGEGGGAAAPAAAAAAAEGFTYRCLQGELVLAGVFVRVFTEQPDFQLSDPAAFCKALVTYIYQQQQVLAGTAGKAGPAASTPEQQRQQAHLLQALRALRLVLEGAPRLLGLLSTKPAVDPLLECLRPACTAGLAVQTPEGPWVPLPAGGGSEAAAALAASPPPWAAASAVALPGASAAELEGAELALTVLLRLTAHAGCIDALSQDKCIVQAFWLAHRAPNACELGLAGIGISMSELSRTVLPEARGCGSPAVFIGVKAGAGPC